MFAYMVHPNSGIYLGTCAAQLDPLESQNSKKDIYLLPANTTWVRPPYFDPENEDAVWNGTDWKIVVKEDDFPVSDIKECFAVPKALGDILEETINEI